MTVFGLWAGVNLVGEDLVGAGLTSPEPPRKASSARVYNQAMNWIEKGYEERFNPGVLLRPGFDSLRSDPRFQDLVRRIGLPR